MTNIRRRAIAIISQKRKESPAYLPRWGATPPINGYCIEQVARLGASADDCMTQYIRRWTKLNKKIFFYLNRYSPMNYIVVHE